MGDPRQFGGRHMAGGYSGFPGQQPRLNAPSGLSTPFDDGNANPNASISGGAPAPKRRRWYLGIQSKKEPAHVMSEVYKALHVLHFEWIVVAPYRVKCRWQPKGLSAALNHPPSSEDAESDYEAQVKYQQRLAQSRIKIGLQLYKVQQHIYLLDFQRLDGNAFTYMNLCARIITELKTLSGIRTVPSGHDPRFGAEHGGGLGGP
jgi:5'-AMP-activated protein kinase catalytic alpha subunit